MILQLKSISKQYYIRQSEAVFTWIFFTHLFSLQYALRMDMFSNVFQVFVLNKKKILSKLNNPKIIFCFTQFFSLLVNAAGIVDSRKKIRLWQIVIKLS